MVCFRRSLVKGSTAYQYTSLQVQQCYKGLENSVFGIFSWTIWKPADSAMRCISPTCSKPLRCQNLPAAQFHLWSEIYSESKTGGEFLAKQSIIAEGKDHRDTEGHLRFDVPVEDFSVVHVFQRQADLDEPIQDLHRRRDGDREGSCVKLTHPAMFFTVHVIARHKHSTVLTCSSENSTPFWELIFLKRSPPSQ